MSWIDGLRAHLRHMVHRGEAEERMEEEFRFHMEMEVEKNIRSGLSRGEARRRAAVAFGGMESHRESLRSGFRVPGVEVALLELRHAARSLRKSPAFTVAAVLMLALGVGANASVFGLVSATLFRPLPFRDSGRLVTAYQTYTAPGIAPRPVRWSYPEFTALKSGLTTLSVAACNATGVNLSGTGTPVRVTAEIVTASYFAVLGVEPALGRAFLPLEDSVPDRSPVVVLGHALWMRGFGGDPGILGRQLSLNGVVLTVIGVAPREFTGVTGLGEVWILQAMAPAVSFPRQLTTSEHFLTVIGRLGPGRSLDPTRAELTASTAALRQVRRASDEAAGTWTVDLAPLDEARRDPAAVRARIVLAGAVLFVLLIAGMNLSGLVLARSFSRARETAMRAALGAGRRRLIRQALVESGLVGFAAAVVGLPIAGLCTLLLNDVAPEILGRPGPRTGFAVGTFSAPAFDWRVMAFGIGIAVAVGLLSGLVPALRGTRDLTGVLKAGGRGASTGVGSVRRPTFLAVVAAGQVAIALVLLAGAAQLLQGYQRLRAIDPGFVASGLLTFRVSGPDSRYEGPAASPLIQQLLERIEAVPGVVAASVSFCPPLRRCSSSPVYFEGHPDPAEAPTVGRHYVAPTHFRTLGIPLLRGRFITEADRAGRPRVAVINETAANRLWPGEDPIGMRVWFGSGGGFASPDSATEIVGIVGDVLYARPGNPVEPDFYTSYLQFTWPEVTVLVRTAGAGTALVPALARAVAEVDPDLPVFDIRTMDELATDALAAERFASWTVTIFAGIGLLLAALGVYGVMAYMAAQRRREMGIRMALGAAPQSVLKLVIGHGLALAGIGAAAGTLAALGLTRLLSALILDAGTPRPTVFAVALVVLLLVTLLTCYLPARAAARVRPMETMAAD